MKRKIIIPIVIILVMAIGTYAAFGAARSGNQSQVKVVTAQKGTIQNKVAADGVVQEKEKREVSLNIAAKVQEVLVKEGDKVQKGQPLIKLDAQDVVRQIKQAEINLENDELTLAKLKNGETVDVSQYEMNVNRSNLDKKNGEIAVELAQGILGSAKTAYDAAQKAYQEAKAAYEADPSDDNKGRMDQAGAEMDSAQKELQSAETAFERAKLDLDTAVKNSKLAAKSLSNARAGSQQASARNQKDIAIMENKVELSRMALDNLKQSLIDNDIQEGNLISPMDGIVTFIGVREGSFTQTGAVVIAVSDLSQLMVTGNVSENDISQVKLDNETIITGDSVDGAEYTGKVSRIFPTAQRQQRGQDITSIVPVEITVTGKETLLKPGFNVDINILTAAKENVIVIPKETVKYGQNKQRFVFVVNGGHLEMRPIKIGIETDLDVEVMEGLQAGERIVSNPKDSLKNGDAVKIIP